MWLAVRASSKGPYMLCAVFKVGLMLFVLVFYFISDTTYISRFTNVDFKYMWLIVVR